MSRIFNYALSHIFDQLFQARCEWESYGAYTYADDQPDFRTVLSTITCASDEIDAVLQGSRFSEDALDVFDSMRRGGLVDYLVDGFYDQLDEERRNYGDSHYEKAKGLFESFVETWLNVQPEIESHIIQAFVDH